MKRSFLNMGPIFQNDKGFGNKKHPCWMLEEYSLVEEVKTGIPIRPIEGDQVFSEVGKVITKDLSFRKKDE